MESNIIIKMDQNGKKTSIINPNVSNPDFIVLLAVQDGAQTYELWIYTPVL